MRPKGTTAQLAVRREHALRLLRQGNPVAKVALLLGVSPRSVQRWQQTVTSPKRTAKPPSRKPGRPSRLTAPQLRLLEKALQRGAYARGYAGDFWTLDRIAHLIFELFSVRYHPSAVWHILKRLGWSCQKPQRVALQRDDQTISHWQRYVWSHIKKWRIRRATLIFEDESGFSLVSPLKRTWAPRGQTPKVRTSLQHHQRINVIGALLITPAGRKIKLRAKRREVNLTGEHVSAFLKHLLRRVRGPMLLVWDRAPIHQRKMVQELIHSHRRLEVYNFPTCAPELNPVEFVWTQAKEYLASTAPQNIGELRGNVQSALQRTRVSQKRLRACLHASDLAWKHDEMRR